MTRTAVLLALVAGTANVASADPPARPAAFYLVRRAEPPPMSAAVLPADARPYYADWMRLRNELRSARGDRARTELGHALGNAEALLLRAMRRRLSSLDPAGWLLLGDLELTRETALAGETESDPALDPTAALAAYRHAQTSARVAPHARLAEAVLLGIADRDGDARAALAIVASSGEPGIAAEARFRLGEIAFERSQYGEAAEWYARGRAGIAAPNRVALIYKQTWALYLAGRDSEALASSLELPAEASDEMKAELEEIKLDIRMRLAH
jgi:hypothetical protein